MNYWMDQENFFKVVKDLLMAKNYIFKERGIFELLKDCKTEFSYPSQLVAIKQLLLFVTRYEWNKLQDFATLILHL